MDSSYIEHSAEDSHYSRLRSNSRISKTTSQFQALNIKPTAPSSTQEEGTSLSTKGPTTNSPFLNPDPLPSSSNLISAPRPQQVIPFPDFSQVDLDSNWSSIGGSEEQRSGTPLLRLDSVPTLSSSEASHQRSISRSNSFPARMDGTGVHQFESTFDTSNQQLTYTWPRFENGDQFLSAQMSPPMMNASLNPYDENFMPLYARSISSSPPRGNLTPEQRELKRQRELARRDSKVRMRRDRSISNPYTSSPIPSPEMMSRTLSEYSNQNLAPSPHLSQGSQGSPNMSAMGSPNYLSSFTPQIGDSSNDMFGNSFSMPPNDLTAFSSFVGMPNFSMMDNSMQSFVPRPHSLSTSSDQPNMQHLQAIYDNAGLNMEPDQVRVVHSRPKPQCWEHGCNGRTFSTFSNLLRHQREKSGQATKSSCPNCGAEFTRTTARNGHMAHEKCKNAQQQQQQIRST
ncbi:hypothetical protein BJ878DRAFT_488344 [Calycina marina]|uniref:C2H2-type domain-containing protein n=1 Tax=Calycina marina TaxID=1763456 RepID=A0A9P7ZBM7_9HELO|nr:hypothetical protein BJ878DRAFT_488344 [Calycina marina]